MKTSHPRQTLSTLFSAAVLSAALGMPAAVQAAPEGIAPSKAMPMLVATGTNPCAAANPCAAKTPRTATNPCAAQNPCAAKNPCAAMNPCAAKK